METCETVKITADNEQGFIVINATDYDQSTQTLFGSDTISVATSEPEVKVDKQPWEV